MKEDQPKQIQVRLKAYSTKELAVMYDVSEKIFRTWLTPFKNEIGKKAGRFYTPKQAQIIFERVGIPDTLLLN